jgi:hypothetical protein
MPVSEEKLYSSYSRDREKGEELKTMALSEEELR